MARISLHPRPTLTTRVVDAYSRRRFGTRMQPAQAMGHQPQVLRTTLLTELAVARWDRLDHRLTVLAELAASVRIGCSWCVDFGFWQGYGRGIPADVLREVPRWRDSDVFTPVERRVLEFAEAATATPPEVTDELVDALRHDLGEAALVELTMTVALENQRSRFNAALGLSSQGFADRCELAEQHR